MNTAGGVNPRILAVGINPQIPETGVEPVYPKGCQILSLVRLPFRHSGLISNLYPLSWKTSGQTKKRHVFPINGPLNNHNIYGQKRPLNTEPHPYSEVPPKKKTFRWFVMSVAALTCYGNHHMNAHPPYNENFTRVNQCLEASHRACKLLLFLH